jgi:hypothetical protein
MTWDCDTNGEGLIRMEGTTGKELAGGTTGKELAGGTTGKELAGGTTGVTPYTDTGTVLAVVLPSPSCP